MTTIEERQKILQMIATGKITPEEGAQLLQALGGSVEQIPGEPTPGEQAQAEPEYEVIDPPPPAPEPPPLILPDTRHWWQVPLWIGVAILTAGAFIFAGALQSGLACLLLLCGLPALALGLLLIIVAWSAHQGPWVHIRVKHRRPGERNVNISVPLDLSVAAVRVAGPFVPQMRETGVDEVLSSLKGNITKDQPMVIDVNDDEDGEHVQVIVG